MSGSGGIDDRIPMGGSAAPAPDPLQTMARFAQLQNLVDAAHANGMTRAHSPLMPAPEQWAAHLAELGRLPGWPAPGGNTP